MMMQKQNQKFKQNCQTSLHKFLQLFYHQAKATSQISRGPRSIRPGDTEHTIIINIIITFVIMVIIIIIAINILKLLSTYICKSKLKLRFFSKVLASQSFQRNYAWLVSGHDPIQLEYSNGSLQLYWYILSYVFATLTVLSNLDRGILSICCFTCDLKQLCQPRPNKFLLLITQAVTHPLNYKARPCLTRVIWDLWRHTT